MIISCAPKSVKRRRVVGPVVKLTQSALREHDCEWDTLVNAAPTVSNMTHKVLVPSSIKGRSEEAVG